VISDVVMPGEMNGVDLAEQIRIRWPAVGVLLTSGFAGDQRSPWPARTGGTPGLLGKPFDLDQLARVVRDTLDAPAAKARPDRNSS